MSIFNKKQLGGTKQSPLSAPRPVGSPDKPDTKKKALPKLREPPDSK